MTFLEELGSRLKLQRMRKGWTQKEVADKLAPRIDISEQQISAIERGISGTSLENFTELSLLFNKTPDYFCLGIGRNFQAIDEIDKKILERLNLCSTKDKQIIYDIINVIIDKNS